MAAEVMGIVFYSVDKIFNIAHAITEAVETVRQNKKECKEIGRSVARVKDVMTSTAVDPAMCGALGDLAASLERALKLVMECQEKPKMLSILGAKDIAKELRWAHDDIMRKVSLGSFAAINIMLYNMQYASPPPSPLLPRPVLHAAPPILASQPQLTPWPKPLQTNQWSSSQVAPSQKPPSMAELCCPRSWLLGDNVAQTFCPP